MHENYSNLDILCNNLDKSELVVLLVFNELFSHTTLLKHSSAWCSAIIVRT